jgi:hypothetical protein
MAKSPPAKPAKRGHRAGGPKTGQALIDAMQASPHREFDIEQRSERMPVREVSV